jgi:hypothetical protein
LPSERHFSRMVEIQVVAVECVVFVVGDVERRRLESEEMQKECDVEYAGTVLDFEIEEASFVAQLIHGGMGQIHHHRRHHHPSSPFH